MPRDNPKGTLVNEIALISEEIDRLERYLREPESLQARVQELIAQRADLLVKFREAQKGVVFILSTLSGSKANSLPQRL